METILIDVNENIRQSITKFLKLLELLGFKIHTIKRISLDELSKGRLIIIVKSFEKYTLEERKLLYRQIQAGHRAFILLDPESAPFFDSIQELLEATGVRIIDKNVESGEDGSNFVLVDVFNRKHRITMGLKEVYLKNPKVVLLESGHQVKIEILARSSKVSNPNHAILSVAIGIGNGRIVVISSWSILENEMLLKGDNIKFVLNSIAWLLDEKLPEDISEAIRKI